MQCNPGDIVLFENAVAGKMKYHLCVFFDVESGVHSFIFLNSKGGFRDQFEIDCGRIAGMPPSRTGRTSFDCPTVHRKTAAQLATLKAKVICQLPKDVAEEFFSFAAAITSMTIRDKVRLLKMLASLK